MDQNQLRDLEAQCIQDCAPTCTATCPLHVDVRAMIAEVARGNFTGGLLILKKSLPFPGIVGRICDQPCQAVCRRSEAIAIAVLERACADWGGAAAEKASPAPMRKQRVAIVGGGLCGLTAAYDLAKKRYGVAIYEARSSLGGSLWETPDERLPHEVIEAETGVLQMLGVEIHLGSPVSAGLTAGRISLGQLQREYSAVFLAMGSRPEGGFSLDGYDAGLVAIDPITYATSQVGVFSGGAMLARGTVQSPITAMADGRRAATSIDRHIQRVSLTASRAGEGPYESCLYTNTDAIPALPAVPMAAPVAGYTQAEAVREAKRCLRCECMECVNACEYLAQFGSYPKKYARQVYNNLSIVMGTRTANKLINSCSLCGLCGEVCPTDMDMGDLCKHARQVMVAQNHMPPSAHDFALRDIAFSNSDKFALSRHAPGMESSAYVLFPGCQLSASAPEQVELVYALLREKLGCVGLMLGCCGAPADWAGQKAQFEAALAGISAQHMRLGKPKVILPCSSCYQVFHANLPEIEIVSLWELLDAFGLPEKTVKSGAGVVSIHDPCSTRYETQIHASVRRMVGRLGYKVEELPLHGQKTTCCSYGGDVWLANPQLSHATVERRIAESPADYLTYCAMCRDFFADHGKRTLHLLDLLLGYNREERAVRRGPGYSQRHENRARLKEKLLKEVWREAMPEQEKFESIRLIVPEPVQKLMDERLILVEDVQRVIEHAERTGRKLRQPVSGHLLAHHRPTQVTYWVEYAPQDDGFIVYNAYSHRMELDEEVKP